MADQSQASLESFLTPEAMLTPGAAGALTMMFTNALSSNFGLSRPHLGLLLSFLCGLLVLVATNRWWVKSIYYVLNSLVIFCVALGANTIGSATQAASASLTTAAFAQTSTTSDSSARERIISGAEIIAEGVLEARLGRKPTPDEKRAEVERILKDLPNSTVRTGEEPRPPSRDFERGTGGFFQPWFQNRSASERPTR
jgi:hypothetical protein